MKNEKVPFPSFCRGSTRRCRINLHVLAYHTHHAALENPLCGQTISQFCVGYVGGNRENKKKGRDGANIIFQDFTS